MKMICVLLLVFLAAGHEINIHSDGDCLTDDNPIVRKKFAVLVNFLPTTNYHKESCAIDIGNDWPSDMQNGLGLFLPRPIECSTTIIIECLPGSTLLNRTTPSAIQYTCHTSVSNIQMPCSSIRLTFKRNVNMVTSNYSSPVQVTALAHEPCTDKEVFFRCRESYPQSCIDEKLHCNGRSECPNGDDERDCHHSPSDGVPVIVIILVVLAFLCLICVLSAVLICCCCRAACNSMMHRFRQANKNSSVEKGEIVVIHGEDAGLMKGLTAPTVVEALPQQNFESTTVVIDSTKPVYPRLN